MSDSSSLLSSVTTTEGREFASTYSLLHADSGAGKTTSLRTLPSDKTLVVGFERGLLPLRNYNYMALRINEYDGIRELIRTFQEPVVINDKEIRILAIDSLSAISDLCKKQIVEVDRKKLIKDRTNGRAEVPKGVYDEQMTQEDWGLYTSRMKSIISALCHLPVHVICTCLSDWKEDKQSGAISKVPALNGKIALECPANFDLVLHMESIKGEKGEDIRVWRTFNDGKIMCKDASGCLDPYETPDWQNVFRKILSTKKENK